MMEPLKQNMSVTLGSRFKFCRLCRLFEKINIVKGAQKVQEIRKFLQEYRNFSTNLKLTHPDLDTSLFQIFRLLLPNLDRERGPYGLKIKNLKSLYIKIFCLEKFNINVTKLRNCNRELSNRIYKNTDFMDQLYCRLRNRLKHDDYSSLTIQCVNNFLDEIAKSFRLNKNKEEVFKHFMCEISGLELKWITRILLKDLRIGLQIKHVLEALHPDAEKQFNLTSNLRQVCECFADLHTEVVCDTINIEIFSFIQPMLLERLQIENINQLFLDNQEYYVQTKFDGERSQLHMKEGKFKYFTRQGYDITGNRSFGELLQSEKFLTLHIASLLKKKCKSIILDGELMGWHKGNEKFGSKSSSYDVKTLREESLYQPCFVAFDILLYNDKCLIKQPYSERLKYLKIAFAERKGVIIICETEIASNIQQLQEFFNISLENNNEGIVVKKSNGLYLPNVREKSGCFKIKAEYSDGLVQDLDLIILGGYYGFGRYSGVMSSFLLGVSNTHINESGCRTEFFAVVTVRSGLRDVDLTLIEEKLKPYWKDAKPNEVFGPKVKHPNKWISPKNSVVVQLRATEIIKTHIYPIGYSLRFPRVLKVRSDKPWHDICSKHEFLGLIKDKDIVQTLTKKEVAISQIKNSNMERRTPNIHHTKKMTSHVYDTLLSKEYYSVTRLSRLFEQREFYVLNGNAKLGKNAIVKILHEHMAKVVQNPGKDTFCILIGNPESLKARNIISGKLYNVVNLDWLHRVTLLENYSRTQEFYPWELYAVCSRTKSRLDKEYDQYWDSYDDNIERKSFIRIMSKAERSLQEDVEFSSIEVKKLDHLLFNSSVSQFSVFRDIVGYFHNKNDGTKYFFNFMSGVNSTQLNTSVNYVFVGNYICTEVLEVYKKKHEELNIKQPFLIVKNKWIKDCFLSRRLFSTENYIV